MSGNELEKLLALPEYKWVKEDLLPAYYVLSKMKPVTGNGYLFLPTSEENIVINLTDKKALSDLQEVEQVFANWIGRERITTDYHVVGGVSYCGHSRHHSGDIHEIKIDITGPLMNIAKKEFEKRKHDLKFDFKIKTIYDLFFFKYLLSNTNVTALRDTGFLSVVTKDGRWDSWNDSAEDSAKSVARNLISCNEAFMSEAVTGTIAGQLRKEERFYESMDSLPERCKVVEHSFNSSSCYRHCKYAIPSEVWSEIKTGIDGCDYESIIKPSLSKLEEEYGDVLNEITFLEFLKQEKVDANG